MRNQAIIIIFFLILNNFTAFAQVGVHTDFPDNSSAMDIVATNRGLLIPRVTLTGNLSSPSPVTAPAVGLLVFNSGANQAIGFYFWNGSSWSFLSSAAPGGNFWSLTGNAGTTPGTNFLGTTDNQHFLIYSNNAERMRFESDGQVIIGGTAPLNSTDLFTVFGNTTQNAAINAYSPRTGFQTNGGRYGILSTVDTATGFALYSRNLDAIGYGIVTAGSGYTTVGLISGHTAGLHSQGYDGVHAWGKDAAGYGICAMGANAAGSFVLAGHAAGVSAVGYDGILARGSNASGRGIIAVGSGQAAPSISNESEGGAFTGYHGIYARGVNASGIGVIGVGSNLATYSTITGGLGGSFTGNYGAYGKGTGTEGVGVLGLGSNGGGYFTITNGSGGSFTGYHGLLAVGTSATDGMGVVAAGNNSSYTLLPAGTAGSFTAPNIGAAGFGNSVTAGVGLVGAGNNAGASIPVNGAGGSFSGNVGLYSKSVAANGTGIIGLGNNIATPGVFANGTGGSFIGTAAGAVSWGTTAATGTGIIGVGNNIATPLTYANGGGGAFTGTAAGIVAYGTTAASGVGVIGLGNNITTANLPGSSGCGGAFSGLTYGVYGFATTASSTRGGGYFACNPTSGGAYCYAGYRNGSTNYKTLGNGTNSTIVKNTQGDLITLYCPEAPEVVFQDYGIGQLVNGFAHITIDPDLTTNINVSAEHPLKVFITLEGDCLGVFVTGKSASGFDVKELQGGKSNVPFSWQIVATRANEQTVLRDGSIEFTVYDQRFGPAPGPLEVTEQPATINQINILETMPLETKSSGRESYKEVKDYNSATLEVKEDQVIELKDDDVK
jgi:hypothetical protein